MRPAWLIRPALITLALLAPATGRAQVTAEQAQSLEQQLHDWLNGMVGSLITVTDQPVRITPDGDHYRVEIPMAPGAAALGFDAGDATITAEARPLPGDRWALDKVHIPNVRVSGAAGGTAAGIGWSMHIAEQQISAVIDPSLATASTFDAVIAGQTATAESAAGAHASKVQRYAAHGVWLPTGDGRVDMLGNSMGEKLAASQMMPDGTAANWSIERLQSNVRVGGVATGSLGAIVRAALDLVPVAKAAQQRGGLPPAARQTARTLLLQLRGLLTGFEGDETLEGMHIEAAGHGGSAAKLAIGFGAGAKQGKLDIHLRLAIDGVDSPDIPAGALRDYLPRHIALNPRVFGVPVEEGTQLLLQAIDSDDPNNADLSEQAAALLKDSPLTVGVDDVELDLGPARLHGSGALEVAAADDISGAAEITVTGLDALMKQAATVPELKPALPVLIMMKGLGQQDGNETTWKITYSDSKVMVNDNDLSALLPGGR